MSENETQEASVAETVTATETKEVKSTKCSKTKQTIGAVVVVVIIILGVLYVMEKEGRSSTTLFTGLIERQEASRTVATVNGVEIINSDLQRSVQQFSQVAVAQGVDTTSADAQAEIENQALEVLINTELLKQEAASRGLTVTEEEVADRLSNITTEIGGEEVLAERMSSLGIETDQLMSDINDELLIQKLLEGVFAEKDIQITEEEVLSVYEGAGGAAAGLPALEEVREQVEAQLIASKEQTIIDELLASLKGTAAIEIE